ncbi:DUF6506 family protein [Amycolatopsis suaedae]|uniref:Uncharacterized protein n=1 Tax=Amycolatopsis suaedae TaxID=2510978 RepID=A0A4Q7J8M6_9PSEU|nr:DUF6506 family protein [Amycolatopsis suaedae]RZQ62464.1 hypothetical protein EWH70_19610 [Amycolatopsis suaedae]
MRNEETLDGAFLFLRPGAPADGSDRQVLERTGSRTVLVWVPDAAAAAAVAGQLVADGIRLIELYRGFDLASAAPVIEAVAGRVPVGVAGYGPAVKEKASPRRTVTIYDEPGSDPAGTQRLVRDHGAEGSTTVVGAPDPDSAARVAAELVDGGAELIEICGGTSLITAARVAAEVGDRVPVSLVSWPFDSIEGAAAYKAAF